MTEPIESLTKEMPISIHLNALFGEIGRVIGNELVRLSNRIEELNLKLESPKMDIEDQIHEAFQSCEFNDAVTELLGSLMEGWKFTEAVKEAVKEMDLSVNVS